MKTAAADHIQLFQRGDGLITGGVCRYVNKIAAALHLDAEKRIEHLGGLSPGHDIIGPEKAVLIRKHIGRVLLAVEGDGIDRGIAGILIQAYALPGLQLAPFIFPAHKGVALDGCGRIKGNLTPLQNSANLNGIRGGIKINRGCSEKVHSRGNSSHHQNEDDCYDDRYFFLLFCLHNTF